MQPSSQADVLQADRHWMTGAQSIAAAPVLPPVPGEPPFAGDPLVPAAPPDPDDPPAAAEGGAPLSELAASALDTHPAASSQVNAPRANVESPMDRIRMVLLLFETPGPNRAPRDPVQPAPLGAETADP
jgi:hypothetical protein